MNQCADAAWEQVVGESTTKKDGENEGGPDETMYFIILILFLNFSTK
jgi:hypothetical protein